jgi:hypothetical protein
MNKKIVVLLTILAFILMSSFKTLKKAYQEEGMDMFGETHWIRADMPVKYEINEQGSADIPGDGEFTAINNAFNTWTSVECGGYKVDLEVQYLGKTPDRVGYFDGKNTIDFVENKSEWPPEAGAQAIAFTLPNIRADGIIIEADLRFNGVNYIWSTSGSYNKMDVETIALHELGHFFGLADLYDNYSCYVTQVVMCGYGGGGTKRSLKQDDKDGICYLYDPTKYYECHRITDCKNGFVCKPYVNLEGITTTYCLEPYCVPVDQKDPYCNDPLNTKAVDPGQLCGDINNTPLNVGDDIFCKNQMCLPSGVCSGVCVSDGDCPENMKCETITIQIEENTNATLKACNTPMGCKSNRGCPSDKACTIYKAGSALISVCNSYIGTKEVGEQCNNNSECKTGVCYNNYCSAFCSINSDCSLFGSDYRCTGNINIQYEGLSRSFSICTKTSIIQDAGVDVADVGADDIQIVDVVTDAYYSDAMMDGGLDSGIYNDVSGDSFTNPDIVTDSHIKDSEFADVYRPKDVLVKDLLEVCSCDETYMCDPDCECDPECGELSNDGVVSSGCSCSLID